MPTQITHHKIIGTGTGPERRHARARRRCAGSRRDVTIDQYPYTASSTASTPCSRPGARGRQPTSWPASATRPASQNQDGHRRVTMYDRAAAIRRTCRLRVRWNPVAGREEPRRDHARPRRRCHNGGRRGDGHVGRGAGGASGIFHAIDEATRTDSRGSGHDDRIGRRGADLRPGISAPAQLRDVRACARTLRPREALVPSRGRAQDSRFRPSVWPARRGVLRPA